MAYTTINKSSLNMNTKLYTGNGGTNAQTGVGFQPDFLWFKNRNTALNHMWFDSVRGINKYIYGNLNQAQGTSSSILTARGSDGFTVGANDNVNKSSSPIVAWNWKAGSSFSNSAGANGATIASSGSVNATAGFSIISYTGTNGTAKVAHGLGVAPSMIIFSSLDNGNKNRVVYHKSLTNAGSIYIDETAASSTSYDYFADTSPTASVFTVKKDSSYDEVNNNGTYFIAYCFAEKQGYSKISSYKGSGNADGTFVYTGFKPTWIMIKRTDAANQWIMLNNKMSLYNNNTGDELYADSGAAQNSFTDGGADFLSNGFKLRGTNASVNGNNMNYIFMAFGQSIVGTNNIPATAR